MLRVLCSCLCFDVLCPAYCLLFSLPYLLAVLQLDKASGFRTPAIQLEALQAFGFQGASCPQQAFLVLHSALAEQSLPSLVATRVIDTTRRTSPPSLYVPLTQDDASTQAASMSASGGASVDSTSSKFEWRVVPSVIPGLWDPRILRSQHIAVTVKPVPAPASAWTVDDVLAQACVPLRELCDALGAFVRGCRDAQPTASRDPVNELVGSLPLDVEDGAVSS